MASLTINTIQGLAGATVWHSALGKGGGLDFSLSGVAGTLGQMWLMGTTTVFGMSPTVTATGFPNVYFAMGNGTPYYGFGPGADTYWAEFQVALVAYNAMFSAQAGAICNVGEGWITIHNAEGIYPFFALFSAGSKVFNIDSAGAISGRSGYLDSLTVSTMATNNASGNFKPKIRTTDWSGQDAGGFDNWGRFIDRSVIVHDHFYGNLNTFIWASAGSIGNFAPATFDDVVTLNVSSGKDASMYGTTTNPFFNQHPSLFSGNLMGFIWHAGTQAGQSGVSVFIGIQGGNDQVGFAYYSGLGPSIVMKAKSGANLYESACSTPWFSAAYGPDYDFLHELAFSACGGSGLFYINQKLEGVCDSIYMNNGTAIRPIFYASAGATAKGIGFQVGLFHWVKVIPKMPYEAGFP